MYTHAYYKNVTISLLYPPGGDSEDERFDDWLRHIVREILRPHGPRSENSRNLRRRVPGLGVVWGIAEEEGCESGFEG